MQKSKKVCSIPIKPMETARESLCLIKKDTVSGMVKLFTQRSIEFDSKAASSSPFHCDLSVIKETSSPISMDSGYDSKSFRRRSKSFGARSIRDSVIDAYAKFPNFKWSQLKYFGVDPREYLTQHHIYVDNIDEHPSVSRKITADLGNDNNSEVFRGMYDRSQTVSGKRPGVKLDNQGPTKKRCLERDQCDETLINAKSDSTTSDLLKTIQAKKKRELTVKKSVQNCNDRKLNKKPTLNIGNLKLRIQESIAAYDNKCEQRECKKRQNN